MLGVLGRGGKGVVYRAQQEHLNREVALKMILWGEHAGRKEHARFLTEAESIARVRHPGIVEVFDFGTHEGMPFFSLELCQGGSLAERLAGTPLPPRVAAGLVEQIARAVQAAHQAGVIHRDLKPANVLLADDGAPRVTDFGLAKRVEGSAGLTQTGAVIGTPSYMAPEQADGNQDVGVPADVYALGAILYECLTGRPPFRSATPQATLLQVINEEPVAVRQLQPAVPVDLETICLKCLQKEQGKRYASAEELAEDLQRYLERRPITARPVGRLEWLVRWCRREPMVASLLAAVLLVMVAGTTVSVSFALVARQREKEAREEKLRADENARQAKENEERARRQKEQTEEQRDRAERLAYVSKLTLAQQRWKDKQAKEALETLEQCRRDLRGWEHQYLWTLFNTNQRTLRGHTKGVNSVAWSPDGKRIVSGSDDGWGRSERTLKLWDVETERQLHTLTGHRA
jgi:hypothetical protein